MKATKLLSAVMTVIMAFSFVSCGDDEPENNSNNVTNPTITPVSPADLIGEWMIVQNTVLYSQVDPSKTDEEIYFSGMYEPKYRFYNVNLIDDDILYIREVSITGTYLGSPIELVLADNILATHDGDVAGKIISFAKPSVDQILTIEWVAEYSPINYNAPVVSTYYVSK